MKALDELSRAPARLTGLILLFDGEVARLDDGPDEHNRTDILTLGL